MAGKTKIYMGIDLSMLVLLPCLMAYSLIGETAHEWMGIAIFLLFLIHHGLNAYWHSNLLKGRYSVMRGLEAAVDILMFTGIVLQGFSGFLMSRYVFAFIKGRSGMIFARAVHMLCAYWLFVLMSVHLGFHGSRILQMAGRLTHQDKATRLRTLTARIIAMVVCCYGAYALWKRQVGSYLFMRIQFAFFDYTESVIWFLLDYFAIMCLFAIVGYYLKSGLIKLQKRKVGR